jgi:arylamine N-acetyltransferase
MASNKRPVFSRDQVQAYFDRLRLPERHRKFSVDGLSGDELLKHLEVLQKYHLQAIPFENLSLHYAQQPGVTLNINALFKKIVLTPGRGGYCMENNCMLGTLLRSVGYTLYSAGGRVRVAGDVYTSW